MDKVLGVLTGGGRGEMGAQPVVSYNLVLSGDFGTTASWGGGCVGGCGHPLELARCLPTFLRKENALVTHGSLPYS